MVSTESFIEASVNRVKAEADTETAKGVADATGVS